MEVQVMAQKKKTVKTTQKNKKPLNKKSKKDEKKVKRIYEIELVLLISATIIFVLALHTDSVGILGNLLKNITFGLFARGGYMLPYLIFFALFLRLNKNFESVRKRYIGAIMLLFVSINFMFTIGQFNFIIKTYSQQSTKLFSINGIQQAFSNGEAFLGGGVINNILTLLVYSTIGKYGLLIVTITLFIIGIILLTNLKFKDIFKKKDKVKSRSNKSKQPVLKTHSKPIAQEQIQEELVSIPLPETKKEIKIFNYNDFNQMEEEPPAPVNDKELVTELNKMYKQK